MKTLIAISTFQKTDALAKLVKSLVEHNYHEGAKLLICDDNANQDYKLTKKDNPNHPFWSEVIHGDVLEDWMENEKTGRIPGEVEIVPSPLKFVNTLKLFPTYKDLDIEVIYGEKRGGVAINKNRGIKYFLEHSEFDELLMLDDDIVFTAPGLLEAIRSCGQPHMTGFLGSKDDPDGSKIAFGETAQPFFKDFPPMGETPTHFYCAGSQGMMLWYTRECIERVGFMDPDLPSYYGFDHSLHSGRINALYGRFIDWFPVLKNCGKFFHTQTIPNNYVACYKENQKYWEKRKVEIFRGINLKRDRGGV